jgi:PAS domain S-box-containing protein
MEQGRQSGDIFLTEYRIVQPDGSIRWMLARGRCYLKQTGEADRFIGVSIDITSRKRAEAALNDSMERFQQVAENVADFIWEVDAKGLYHYTSPAVEKILGYSPGELDGKMHFYDLFAPEVREELKGAAFQVIARKDAFRKFPNPNIRKDGEVVHLETSGVPILDGEGNLVGYRGADSDVTERWMAEQQIAMQRNQLLHLSRVSTMGQLASSLAHELNQPLGAILRNAEAAELLLEDPLPDLDEVRAILADICKDDHRAGDVINRMRGLLKRGKLERRPLDIERLVEEIATLMRPDIDFHKVKLDSQIDGSVLPSVYGDPVQLQQVLLNLLANAVEALKQNPRESRLVTVRARRVGITVEVAVSDTGPGIPEHELFRVFEPFFSSKSDGLGMGLAISRTIIEAHGGRLWAENKTTGGTTFTFALPVSKDSGPTMGGGGR